MRVVLIVIAFIAAGVVSLMTSRYLSGHDRRLSEAEQAAATTEVLVAAGDLEIGQTVSEKNLKWQTWPKDNVHPKYMTRQNHADALKKLSGAAVRQPMVTGEPVTEAKLVQRDGTSVLSVILREGHRAITIKVDEAQGLAGLVRPGDMVDVILTHKITSTSDVEERAERTISEVIAKGVRVLASGQEIKSDEDKSKLAKSITIEVDAQQAEAVSLGRAMGTLSLALRSAFADDEEQTRDQDYTSDADITGPLKGRSDKRIKVLTTTRPLEAGTLLAEADLVWAPLPEGKEPEQYLLEEQSGHRRYQGALLLTAATSDQPLRKADIVRPSESRFVPLALRPGYRALSVAIAQNTAVGGFITAGDLVDIIYTDEVDDETGSTPLKQRSWSETVAQGVRVLSIETALDPKTQLPTVGGTATLEATPNQAQKIALAANMGKITLSLRSKAEQDLPVAQDAPDPLDADSILQSTYTTDVDMSEALRNLIAPVSTGSAGMPLPASGRGMTIIRGTERSDVNVSR